MKLKLGSGQVHLVATYMYTKNIIYINMCFLGDDLQPLVHNDSKNMFTFSSFESCNA